MTVLSTLNESKDKMIDIIWIKEKLINELGSMSQLIDVITKKYKDKEFKEYRDNKNTSVYLELVKLSIMSHFIKREIGNSEKEKKESKEL